MAKSNDNFIPKKILRNRVYHQIPSDIDNNRELTQPNQQNYSRPTIIFTNFATCGLFENKKMMRKNALYNSCNLLTVLICMAFMFETSSKFSYIETKSLPHIADQRPILPWKYCLETWFIIVFFFVDLFMVLMVGGDDTSDSIDPSSFKSYQIMSLINIIAIFLLGLASDAMPFGNEGNPLLTWNKFWQTANNEKFSYSLAYCIDPNYNLNAYRNGVSDFYNVVVNLNRVLNYTETDQFLTNHNCTVDDLASFLRSIHSFYISAIYC